jgi:ubiquinone/menaquinone biosynthesis C-methylase UbiE
MIRDVAIKNKTQKFYDRIADFHNLTLKINGYRSSVAKYLRSLNLEIDENSRILDAGCGTGIVSLAFYSAGYRPKETIALDLSFKSLGVAHEQFREDKISAARAACPVQGNLLTMPFEDGKFDVILTCGALEYVPLDKGIEELSRVLKPNGLLIMIPIHPSLVGTVLEIIYNFKIHSRSEIKKVSAKHFDIIDNYRFPPTDPISWSKSVFLLRKK